jgi:hypothetical protein
VMGNMRCYVVGEQGVLLWNIFGVVGWSYCVVDLPLLSSRIGDLLAKRLFRKYHEEGIKASV